MNRNDILELCRTNPPAVADLVLQLQATVTAQQEQILTLTARVAALEARLKTDSHNSSKPPSSDPPTHKPVSLRKPTGRKPGGQAGHSGRTLTLSDTPDVVVTHTPAHCADCHADLHDTPAAGRERRQVLDVPPLTLVVTEHQREHKVCPHCGHLTQAAFPETVTQPVQYGPRVQALGVYLLTYQLLPLKRASELLGDVFSTTFCAATLYAAQQRAASLLQPASEQIAHAVQQVPITFVLRCRLVRREAVVRVRKSGRAHYRQGEANIQPADQSGNSRRDQDRGRNWSLSVGRCCGC